MTEIENAVVNIVVAKLTAEHIAVPDDLVMSVMEVEQAIMNYCNIDEVPSALRFTWASMVADYCRWIAELSRQKTSTAKPSPSASAVALSSLKEGDTSLGFSVDTESASNQASKAHSLSGVLDKFVLNYADALNRFRRVVW